MSMSIPQLADRLRTESDAYLYLEELRWGGQPVCPHCGSVRSPYFLTPANGCSRKTRTGSPSERRVWKCADCRKQFSVLTGTVFHGTKIPVRIWCFVVFEMASSKNGVSAREIERKYGLTGKTAWFMMHRIREAMKHGPFGAKLTGRVVADESWIGGDPKNRHATHPRAFGTPGKKTEKATIFTLISRETGEVRSRVIPDIKGSTLRAAMADNLDPAITHLHTDGWHGYRHYTAEHSTVDHSIGEYVRGDVSTNQAENYFSQLKRSIDGTYHHVSREHLERYLAEFDFRHSTCKQTDTERFGRLVGQTGGRRLAYQQAG